MPQVQFLSMRSTQSVVSEVQTVSMKPVDESNLSCSFKWMVSWLTDQLESDFSGCFPDQIPIQKHFKLLISLYDQEILNSGVTAEYPATGINFCVARYAVRREWYVQERKLS